MEILQGGNVGHCTEIEIDRDKVRKLDFLKKCTENVLQDIWLLVRKLDLLKKCTGKITRYKVRKLDLLKKVTDKIAGYKVRKHTEYKVINCKD